MYRLSIWIAILGLLTTGCDLASTGDAPSEQIFVAGRVQVDAIAAFAPGFACGSALIPPGSPIPTPQPLDDEAREALEVLRAKGPEGEQFVTGYEYGIHSRTDDELILLSTGSGGTRSSARFLSVDGQWEAVGWGTCHWQTDGYISAKWQLDPGYEFDPESTTIGILAVDDCGTVLDNGHEVVVIADFAAESITIEVWQALYPPPSDEPAFSNLGCPLQRTVPLTVHLAEPIGSREILGAAPHLG